MFDSIKPWIRIPFTLKGYTGRDGAGTVLYGPPAGLKCYPQGKVELVTNNKGVEVRSTLQLYVAGDTVVSYLDSIIFEDNAWTIKSIGTFYDGNTGLPDIKVVYL